MQQHSVTATTTYNIRSVKESEKKENIQFLCPIFVNMIFVNGESEDVGLRVSYREPDQPPGPSPVPPMETPYLQREARPGAEQGP